MNSAQPYDLEHRWGQRIACGASVRLSAAAGNSVAGKLRDVSTSGAFIETSLRLPLFSQLVVAVVREDRAREIDTLASVVRVARDGVAVEWFETPGGSICTAFGCATRCAARDSPCVEAAPSPSTACPTRQGTTMRSTDSLRNELEEIFERIDKNGDGSVSFAEFKRLMLELGDLSSDNGLRTSFARIDVDHDEGISFDELSAWLQKSARGLALSSARSPGSTVQS
jgi:hypothetical protein